MLDRPGITLRARRSAPLPVAGLIVGKSATEAAELLPRLFNLCRTAQALGARMAFGLPVRETDAKGLREEILREHLIRFCLKWPGCFGDGPTSLPDGWQTGSEQMRAAIFGSEGVAPRSESAFHEMLDRREGVGLSLARIRDCFAPGEACAGPLPPVTPETAFWPSEMENSVAGRQAHQPLMRALEARFGRGPLWRAAARLLDAEDAMENRLPDPVRPAPGTAVVPAARGSYAISAKVQDGIAMDFRRITPTDHLLASGGILDQSLNSLPAAKSGLASLVLEILDPCTPVRLEEVEHA